MISKRIGALLWRVSFFALVAIILQSCGGGSGTPSKTTKRDKKTRRTQAYQEDLSGLRPSFEAIEPLKPVTTQDTESTARNSGGSFSAEPSYDIGNELDEVIEKNIAYNASRNYVTGYSIQIYSGTEVKEKDKVVMKAYELNENPTTTFESPIYRTKVGKFYSRMEANRKLREIKREFPLAVLVTERFKLK